MLLLVPVPVLVEVEVVKTATSPRPLSRAAAGPVGWVGISRQATWLRTPTPVPVVLVHNQRHPLPRRRRESSSTLLSSLRTDWCFYQVAERSGGVAVGAITELADDGPRAGLEAVLDGSLISVRPRASYLSAQPCPWAAGRVRITGLLPTFSGPPSPGEGGPRTSMGDKAEDSTGAGNVPWGGASRGRRHLQVPHSRAPSAPCSHGQ